MSSSLHRRAFMTQAAGAGAVACLGDFGFLKGLPPLSAADVQMPPAVVRFSAEVEPLARLLEESPRNRLLEEAGERVRNGTATYQSLLAALLLAGVRSIKPRPVGFQFHTVLVTNSAHLAAVAAADRDRWLPLFWALDNFKASQERHRQQHGNWQLPAPNESRLPEATQARQRFIEAMDNWDEEATDVAITALVRSAGASEVIELFWRYGARDFRDIGHKAIYAANAWRTLNTIGWRHAEPVMRSLAYALLQHEGTNPAQRDADPDRPWRENLRRVSRIRRDWQQGRIEREAGAELLTALRSASPVEGPERVVAILNRGIHPDCIWDGLFLTAGELLLRQPGIVGLHTVTSVNALHFAYQTSDNPETRQMMMLQGAAFLAMFRARMQGSQLRDIRIDTLEPLEVRGQGAAGLEEVFAEVTRDRVTAARKTLGLMQRDREAAPGVMATARRLIFNKGRDSHDYKFSSATLEDFYHTTPAWRDRLLATSMGWLKGTGDRDNELIQRARAALGNA